MNKQKRKEPYCPGLFTQGAYGEPKMVGYGIRYGNNSFRTYRVMNIESMCPGRRIDLRLWRKQMIHRMQCKKSSSSECTVDESLKLAGLFNSHALLRQCRDGQVWVRQTKVSNYYIYREPAFEKEIKYYSHWRHQLKLQSRVLLQIRITEGLLGQFQEKIETTDPEEFNYKPNPSKALNRVLTKST